MCWGLNGFGQLGSGDSRNVFSPTLVGLLTGAFLLFISFSIMLQFPLFACGIEKESSVFSRFCTKSFPFFSDATSFSEPQGSPPSQSLLDNITRVRCQATVAVSSAGATTNMGSWVQAIQPTG